MHTYYRAVCDKCGESCDLFCTSTFHFKGDFYNSNEIEIHDWLDRHYGCELRLIWRDDQMDELWDNGYSCLKDGRLNDVVMINTKNWNPVRDIK